MGGLRDFSDIIGGRSIVVFLFLSYLVGLVASCVNERIAG